MPAVFTRNHLLRDALGQALYDAMKEDARIHLFGEGAHVKVHYDAPQIETNFRDRVHTMPITEDGNSNFAVGTALMGVIPVVDVIGADFLYRTMDSIANTAAKLDFTTGVEHTIVIRSEFMTGGPTTGQRPEAMFTHIPGLRVAVPSTPRTAYGLMRTALASPGVTLLFEDRMVQDSEEWNPEDLKLNGPYPFGVSWGQPSEGSDVTILTYGVMRQVVQGVLRRNPSLRCDLIDLVSLSPVDWRSITKSLGRTGRLLVIEPDIAYGGVGAEIVAHFAEIMPGVWVKRLGAPMSIIPAAMSLHDQMLPCEEEIVKAIKDLERT